MNTAFLIRKLRFEHQLSQQELADRAGVSFSFVNQVEGGKQTVRLDALNKLLSVFEYAMIPAPLSKKAISVREKKEEPEAEKKINYRAPLKNDWSFFD